jgi:hypothetical protein
LKTSVFVVFILELGTMMDVGKWGEIWVADETYHYV